MRALVRTTSFTSLKTYKADKQTFYMLFSLFIQTTLLYLKHNYSQNLISFSAFIILNQSMLQRLKYFWISDLKNVKHGGFQSHGIPSNPITVSVLPSVQNQTIIFFKKPQNYLETYQVHFLK